MAVLVPVPDQAGDVRTVVEATVALDDVDAALDRLQLLLTLGVVAAHVLGLLLIFAVTSFALRPLTRIVDVVRAIGRGEYAARARLPRGADEAGELGRAFDTMLGEVQSTVERRERNEQMTRQFAADASHELKSPLTVISGYVDVLLRGGADDPPERERALIAIQRESSRMSRLVSDLLTLAQLEAGSWPMRQERVDLTFLAGALTDETRQRVEDRRIICLAEPDLIVLADADSLTRAIRNLVDNALHHVPPGGSVILEVVEQGSTAVITISDDGDGIAAEHLRHVFDRFYRIDGARSRNGSSTGLGLAITRAIILAHGGTIDVSSTQGAGTAFTISLPLAGDAAEKRLALTRA
jgi:two-component system OmpR family sensor kinase